MATTVAILEAKLNADTRDFDRAMGKSDSRMKGLAKTAGKAGLAGAVVGLGLAVRAGFREFQEAQLVSAQTQAVIKSTGGAANVTAKQVSDLSEALMRKSGVDDEQISKGQNMLLTFKNIRNETGKGNDIFTQTTKSLLDMSVAMGDDMQTSAIRLGKALNDPVKGVGALARVGVQFTDEQKKAIKTMVESGDTMGAQKIILKELESQFGGSAEAAGKTFAGQINIARETVLNFLGDLVAKAIPIIQRVVQTVKDNWPDIRRIASNVFDWFKEHVVPIIVGLRDIWVAAVESIAKVVKDNGPELKRIFDRLGEAVEAVGKVAVPILKFYFKEILPPILATVIQIVDKVTAAIEGTITVIKWIGENGGPLLRKFKDAAVAVLKPIITVFDTLAGVIGAVVDGIRWLIDNIGKIPKPKLPSLPDLNPFRAAGGPVKAGGSYIVGERGMELFVPNTNGTIIPNDRLAMSGSGGTTVIVSAPNYVGSHDELGRAVREALTVFERRNARPAFG